MGKYLYTGFEGPWSHYVPSPLHNTAKKGRIINKENVNAYWAPVKRLNIPYGDKIKIALYPTTGVTRVYNTGYNHIDIYNSKYSPTLNSNGVGSTLASNANGVAPIVTIQTADYGTTGAIYDTGKFHKGFGACWDYYAWYQQYGYFRLGTIEFYDPTHPTTSQRTTAYSLDFYFGTLMLSLNNASTVLNNADMDMFDADNHTILDSRGINYPLFEYNHQHHVEFGMSDDGVITAKLDGTGFTYQTPITSLSQSRFFQASPNWDGGTTFMRVHLYGSHAWSPETYGIQGGIDNLAINTNVEDYIGDPYVGIPDPIQCFADLSVANDPTKTGIVGFGNILSGYDDGVHARGQFIGDQGGFTSTYTGIPNYERYDEIKEARVVAHGVRNNDATIDLIKCNINIAGVYNDVTSRTGIGTLSASYGFTFPLTGTQTPRLSDINMSSFYLTLSTTD